jgi:thymidylate kinase
VHESHSSSSQATGRGGAAYDLRPPVPLINAKDGIEERNGPLGPALFAALERSGVRYCHWKSNIRLEQSLSGIEDIDLLVHPSDAQSFQRVINDCGFKLAVSRLGMGHAGVFHALAWDNGSSRLLDLHAYHQLVSGDSFVKSFRFPVEREMLAGTSLLMGVRVPEPTSELVLFLLRVLLKHISVVEIVKVNRHYDECRDELSWLLQRSDLAEARTRLSDWFPSIEIPVQQLVECVAKGSVASRVAMGMRVAWALRNQRRIGHVAAFFSRATRIGKHYFVRARSRRNLSLLSGGAWIALVGPKGTGKSTLAGLLAKGLGKNLDVKTIHLGKPPATWLSWLPRMFVPAMRKALPIERLREYEKPERRLERRYSYLFVVGKLLVAFDRQRLLNRSMRAVSSGTIVISDRCPTTNSTGLDGSAFDDIAVSRARSPLQRWLMERERSIYRRLPKPRVVLRLGAPLTTALERDRSRCKPGGADPIAVKRRWKLESEAEYDGSINCLIDTDGDVHESLRAAFRCVWDAV